MTKTEAQKIREFQAEACAPSFEMMGKGHLVENALGMKWELPTLEEMMRKDYKPRNVFADGSWIPS